MVLVCQNVCQKCFYYRRKRALPFSRLFTNYRVLQENYNYSGKKQIESHSEAGTGR